MINVKIVREICTNISVLKSKPAPADSDHDGMPDQWERAHRLNPESPEDVSQGIKDSAYANPEQYLNSISAIIKVVTIP